MCVSRGSGSGSSSGRVNKGRGGLVIEGVLSDHLLWRSLRDSNLALVLVSSMRTFDWGAREFDWGVREFD